jgi:hypothetical protein
MCGLGRVYDRIGRRGLVYRLGGILRVCDGAGIMEARFIGLARLSAAAEWHKDVQAPLGTGESRSGPDTHRRGYGIHTMYEFLYVR